eukprot:760677-Hanusia_phi.AAC.1
MSSSQVRETGSDSKGWLASSNAYVKYSNTARDQSSLSCSDITKSVLKLDTNATPRHASLADILEVGSKVPTVAKTTAGRKVITSRRINDIKPAVAHLSIAKRIVYEVLIGMKGIKAWSLGELSHVTIMIS